MPFFYLNPECKLSEIKMLLLNFLYFVERSLFRQMPIKNLIKVSTKKQEN